MNLRTYITKSRAGHYRATVKRRFPDGSSATAFQSDKCSTRANALREAAAFIAADQSAH